MLYLRRGAAYNDAMHLATRRGERRGAFAGSGFRRLFCEPHEPLTREPDARARASAVPKKSTLLAVASCFV